MTKTPSVRTTLRRRSARVLLGSVLLALAAAPGARAQGRADTFKRFVGDMVYAITNQG